MKKFLCIVLFIIPVTLFAQQMNIVSFNIRLNTPADGINAWPNRIEMATGLLRFHEADIFGLQEALYGQMMDIEKALPEYAWIGVGRDDGEKGGEFSPIFYRKSAYTLLDHGTFWLSETPDTPSKGWDAALNRIVTWGQFQSKESGKHFMMFNTHFDHRGVEARKKAANLIWSKIKEMTRGTDLPVIVTGDFNLTPETEPIVMLKKNLKDSREVSIEPPYGPVGTFQGFKLETDLRSNRIDYVFVHGNIDVLKYAALTDFKDHRFPSDHLPVLVKINLK